jgi:hypothetical protein
MPPVHFEGVSILTYKASVGSGKYEVVHRPPLLTMVALL